MKVELGLKVGNLFLTIKIDYGMPLARNKLPTLRSNSYLHTQTSEIQVTTNKTVKTTICSV